MSQVSRRIIVLIALVSIFATYCSTAPRQSVLAAKFEDVEKSSEELRAVLHRTTLRFTGVIEECADEIKEQATDVTIQRNVLLWKMYGIPAVHQAAFHPDPVAGLLDINALTFQMSDFFETGYGKQAFGEWQHIARDGLKKHRLELNETMRHLTISGDITVTQQHIRAWADENPMEDFHFQRVSISTMLDTMLYDERRGLFDATALIADGMNDLSGRMKIYTEYLPRQARWQAEYLLLVESSKFMKTVMDSLQSQLNAMLDSINVQRVATLYELQRERIALTDFVQTERIAFVHELNTLTDRSMIDIKGVVDHLRGLGILLGIVLIGVPLALGIIIGRIMQRKG